MLGPDDTFFAEGPDFEIQEEGNIEPGDVEVTQHLGFMGGIERIHALAVDDDGVFHNQIGNEVADEVAAVMDGELALLVKSDTHMGEFDT